MATATYKVQRLIHTTDSSACAICNHTYAAVNRAKDAAARSESNSTSNIHIASNYASSTTCKISANCNVSTDGTIGTAGKSSFGRNRSSNLRAIATCKSGASSHITGYRATCAKGNSSNSGHITVDGTIGSCGKRSRRIDIPKRSTTSPS